MTDEQEKMAITKYDLFYESRMTKVETAIESINSNMNEIKQDFHEIRQDVRDLRSDRKADIKWYVGIMTVILGLMAKGFGWI